jgi:hypothetical protein
MNQSSEQTEEAQVSSPRTADWEIYRFDLVSEASRRSQWQIFQMSSPGPGFGSNDFGASGGSSYRDAINRILTGVCNAISHATEKALKEGRGGFKVSVSPGVRGIDISAKELKARLDLGADLGNIIEYHRDLIDSHPGSAAVKREASAFVADLLQDKPTRSLQSVAAALHLLSLLMIRSDWDVPGAYRLSVNSLGNLKEIVRPNGPGRFFVYQIVYVTNDPIGSSRSENILKRAVRLTLCGAPNDRKDGSRGPTVVGPLDYFELCREPTVHESEEHWYRFYANIIDYIQVQLAASTDPARDPNPINGAAESPVLIVAIPFTLNGYQHFLQAYVRPLNGIGGDDAASELSKNWHEFWQNESIGRGAFSQFTRHLVAMTQADIFRFEIRKGIDGPGLSPTERFCQNVHYLWRVKKAWGHARLWTSTTPTVALGKPKPPSWLKEWGVDKRHGAEPLSAHEDVIELDDVQVEIDLDDIESEAEKVLAKHLAREMFMREYAWLKDFVVQEGIKGRGFGP